MIDKNSQFMAILTNVGAAKLANANALGLPWKLAALGVGDSNETNPMPSATQTKLINERRRAPLNQLMIDPVNPAVIIAEQIIPADVGGWWVREIGLYDEDDDLVAVANCAPSYKALMDQGSARTLIVRMSLIVSSTGNIVLKIDPAVVLATREYVDQSIKNGKTAVAVKLETPRRISLTGALTGSGMFDGTADVSINAALGDSGAIPGTYTKVVIDKKGLVIGNEQLTHADIPSLPWSKITEGKPTTLGGYGITDALTKTGTAAAAVKLETGRTIALAGALTGSTTFDGTGNVSINATLADSGAIPGTYTKVVIDKKGLVVGNEQLTHADIPGLPWGKITDGKPTTLAGYGITDALGKTGTAAAAVKLETGRTIALAGALTGSTTFDGTGNVSINATLADSGVVAGAYPKVVINSKGLVVGSQNLVQSDIPNLPWSRISSGKPTTLDGYGISD